MLANPVLGTLKEQAKAPKMELQTSQKALIIRLICYFCDYPSPPLKEEDFFSLLVLKGVENIVICIPLKWVIL